MENNQALDDNFSSGLNITSDIREFLDETAKWAHFLSILGFVMVGLIILIAIFASTLLGVVINEMQIEFSGVSTLLVTFIYLTIAVINIFPILFLYRFARNTKEALRSDNQVILSEAFKNLKSHYKFVGIAALFMLGLYGLMIFFAIVGSLAL